MYKAIVWDLDGTLLNTTEGVKIAVKNTITELGLEPLDEMILDKFVGPPMQLSFQQYYLMDEKNALFAANRFRAHYKNESLFIAELYPETLTVLKKLSQKGYHMAVATNKSHENAMAILEHFGVAKYCDFAMGSDLEGKKKKADIIKKCLEVLYVNPNEAIYIGDSIFDLEGAQKMGMDFIGVTYGFGFHRGESIGYRLVNSMHEIGEIF